MVDDDGKTTPPVPKVDGETDAERTERENEERAKNKAKDEVKGWVSEALKEELPTILKGTGSSHGSGVQNFPPSKKRKSIFQIITGG